MTENLYTTQLQAGLGMIAETKVILDLWKPGMSTQKLYQASLDSGRFPTVSARRLRNLVAECFAPRFLIGDGKPAAELKLLLPILSAREFEQVLFIHTCRAVSILGAFVREVYWYAYTAGRSSLSNQEAWDFVVRANEDGRTAKPWSDSTRRRVAGYLTGACADFGLLERDTRNVRRIIPFRIEPRVAIVLAYDLHFSGQGDNGVVAHTDWELFGLDRSGVLDELKRLALKGLFIVQSAGNVTRIGWQCRTMKELKDAIA